MTFVYQFTMLYTHNSVLTSYSHYQLDVTVYTLMLKKDSKSHDTVLCLYIRSSICGQFERGIRYCEYASSTAPSHHSKETPPFGIYQVLKPELL